MTLEMTLLKKVRSFVLQSAEHLTRLIYLAGLAAISYLLTLIAIPVIPVAPFLKLDLSDLPILVGLLAFGISGGTTVAVLKWLLHLILTGFSLPNLLGSLSSLIASLMILLTWGLVLRYFNQQRRRTWIVGTLLMTFNLIWVMVLTNLLVIPWYLGLMGMHLSLSIPELILGTVIPFNLIKGILIGPLFEFLSHRLQHAHGFRHHC